jgi:hypothetical protein
MPHLQVGQWTLPFSGKSPRAKASSLSGARIAVTSVRSQAARLLLLYAGYGPSTDGQQAERMGLPEARISARRNALMQQYCVAYHDDIVGPYKAKNGRYALTEHGWDVARVLLKAQAEMVPL